MVMAALTALKSTNDDLGIDTPICDCEGTTCGPRNEPLREVSHREDMGRKRRGDLPFEARNVDLQFNMLPVSSGGLPVCQIREKIASGLSKIVRSAKRNKP